MPLVKESVPPEEEFFTTDVVRVQRWLPWLRLLQAFRIAIDHRCLMLSLLGLFAWTAGEFVLHQVGAAAGHADGVRSRVVWPYDPHCLPAAPATQQPVDLSRVSREPIATLAEAFSNGHVLVWPLARILSTADFLVHSPRTWAGFLHRWALLIWGLFIAGLFGGGICRFAAVEATNSGRGSLQLSSRFAVRHTLDFVWAPLIAAVGFGFFWVLNALFGLITRIPEIGHLLGGVFWFVPLLIGLLLAIVVVGAAAGWPLSIAAVSTEASDAFDGFSRAGSYVFNRPWYGLFLAAFATLYGSALLYVVVGMIGLAVHLSVQSTAAWAGEQWVNDVAPLEAALTAQADPSVADPLVTPSEALLAFWGGVVASLPAAFVFSYFWTATTLIYLLLRRREDGTPVTHLGQDKGAPSGDAAVPLVGVPAAEQRERARGNE